MLELQACYRPLPSALLLLATLALFGEGWAAARGMSHKASAFEQVGIASWYGPGFHGKETATGQVFNQNELTAAHRTLPLGTKVEVTNVTNGKSVKVEINDRGPYIKGRVIDLSRAAAIRLGMKNAGLAKVQIEAIPSYIEGRRIIRSAGTLLHVLVHEARDDPYQLRGLDRLRHVHLEARA